MTKNEAVETFFYGGALIARKYLTGEAKPEEHDRELSKLVSDLYDAGVEAGRERCVKIAERDKTVVSGQVCEHNWENHNGFESCSKCNKDRYDYPLL